VKLVHLEGCSLSPMVSATTKRFESADLQYWKMHLASVPAVMAHHRQGMLPSSCHWNRIGEFMALP